MIYNTRSRERDLIIRRLIVQKGGELTFTKMQSTDYVGDILHMVRSGSVKGSALSKKILQVMVRLV